MNNRIIIILLLLLSVNTASLKAQDGEEYRMEIGVGAGMMGYLGDFNENLTKNLQPMGGIVARYAFNPYMGLKANLLYGKAKGQSTDIKTYYPKFAQDPYKFESTVVDFGITYEYNFWPYGTGKEYRGAQKLTPYIYAGIGATYVKPSTSQSTSVVSANLPIGLGVKYKISERVNLGLQWAMHFTLTDKIDGQKDPYDIVSSGAFKNTDSYSALQITLTYSFMAKCRTCHNDDE